MGGHPFPEIPCIICAKAVDLNVDLFTDENGKAVHEDCYIKRITNQHNRPSVGTMND
ncbi:MAG TPA: hypothetical protein VK722_13360 [Candidatus Aquilonibacter sp.]|jgi:hypothetical protein|nr:hypothetical protein [Candidatus Aquilonibacter sp.]